MKNRATKNVSIKTLIQRQQISRSRQQPTADWPLHESYEPTTLKQESGIEKLASLLVAACLLLGPLLLLCIYAIIVFGAMLVEFIWGISAPTSWT